MKNAFLMLSIIFIGCTSVVNTKKSFNEDNRSFKVISISIGNDITEAPKNATLNINKNNIYGNTGCNNYFSSFKMLEDAQSVQFSYAGSTRMLCHNKKVNDFEYKFLKVLEDTFHIEYTNDGVVLKNDNARINLEG